MKNNTILDTFLAISSWQAFLAILIFFGLTAGLWYGLKKIKIKFIYRVLIGMGLGLIFGIVVQAIIHFPAGGWHTSGNGGIWIRYAENGNWYNLNGYYLKLDDGTTDGLLKQIGSLNPNDALEILKHGGWEQILDKSGHLAFTGKFLNSPFDPVIKQEILWVNQLLTWAQLFKQIFINGILLLTLPIVFLAIFRVVAKPANKGLKRITAKGIAILLTNVAIAFIITFWIGYGLKIGNGMELDSQISGEWKNEAVKSIPEIIINYIPSNFISTFAGTSIIPVMVIAALFGTATKYVSKKQPQAMEKLRTSMDRGWDLFMSMLMIFMKIMPLAVMSMLTVAIISRPIGAMKSIGLVIGTGYLGIFIMLALMTFVVFLSGLNVKAWFKLMLRPLIQGFATQSSNASLPVSIDTLNNQMKISDKVTSVIAPLSTSMGLVACAGVQSGLITSFLWTGSANVQASMSLGVFFIMALFITVIASLGIAGIPGTATVVTAGVLGGLGFSTYFAPVYAVVGALDGLFDMGRTGANVVGGIFAATMVARSEGLFEEGTPLLSEKGYQKAVKKAQKIAQKTLDHEVKEAERLQKVAEKKAQKKLKKVKESSPQQ